MKISKISVKNYKAIKNLELNIDNKSTVFFGENGTGKSSILKAITAVYYPIINRIAPKKNKPILIEEDDISFGETESLIHSEFSIKDNKFSFDITKNRKNSKKYYNEKSIDEISESLKIKTEEPGKSIPIFINYGVHRAVFNIPLRIRNKHDIFNKIVAYENCLNPVTDFKTFFEWYRNQEDIENELVREDKNYSNLPLSSVQNAIYTFLPEISNLKIRRSPKLQMIVTKNNETIQVSNLSDGEKCLIALVGDIARRLAIANPNSKNPLNENGVVLIDEIELHLHPKWQRYIIPNLQKTFANIQFIISTHSPQVLGEVKDTNIFKFERDNGVLQCIKINSTFGKDTNYILEQFMNTKKENSEISKGFEELFELIDERSFDKAKTVYTELSKILTPLHPELVKAEILIRRGEMGK